MKRRNAAVTIAALSTVVALSACTGSDNPQPSSVSATNTSHGGSSSASPTASVPPDLLNYKIDQVAATAKSTTFLSNRASATLSVASVRATPDTTVVTFWVTTATPYASPISASRPETWPKLVDAGTGNSYGVNIFTGSQPGAYCVCTDVNMIEPTRRVLTAQYPPLPTGLSQVTFRLTGFPDLKIPLTR
ncbi:hypothetical protein ATK17_2580 [Branchiibius hedensis]|uniref:Uncharacterized protein n=1 Tax=Branchiibius hedensis TaxID=672460 RepID=A0A2Y8ZS93_9MICO|nr:hypothetical protein [Branchiibius hedensis]PWJ26418.1 hypothetical protein ATK17_2580 [Branchiibius hedensis]SSA35230.1 hypothetical protein SAMN04489750_2580 [Branchiibius hedensis]